MSTTRTALHCLVRAVSNGEYVGCTKLVMPPLTEPLYPLPFEKSCRATLDRTIIDPQALPRQAVGEISRLAVIGKYRRRKGDDGNIEGISDDSFGDEKQLRFLYIPVGRYLGIIEIALQRGVDTMFMLTPGLYWFERIDSTTHAGQPLFDGHG